jgi:mono/diheme cytochrome c family protein
VLGVTALVMLGAIGFSWIGQSNVVEGQLRAGIIGPNAIASPAATASTGTTTGGTGGGAASTAAAGASVYTANCVTCHGATGAGAPGAFPPLAGNPVVVGDPNAVIKIVTGGLTGSITVKGGKYNGTMPAWKGTLTNAQIASVITYIRSSWGNSASAVTEAQVAAQAK